MKKFSFARFVIVLCLIAAIPLGWFAWTQRNIKNELSDSLATGGSIEQLVRQIQQLSVQHSQLTLQADSDKLVGQDSPESYIRGQASKPNVEVGRLKIDPTEKPLDAGVVDRNFRITPGDRDKEYGRAQIANFLFKLEDDSPRVRVTDFEITNAKRNIEPGEIPPDLWKFEAQITSRQREN